MLLLFFLIFLGHKRDPQKTNKRTYHSSKTLWKIQIWANYSFQKTIPTSRQPSTSKGTIKLETCKYLISMLLFLVSFRSPESCRNVRRRIHETPRLENGGILRNSFIDLTVQFEKQLRLETARIFRKSFKKCFIFLNLVLCSKNVWTFKYLLILFGKNKTLYRNLNVNDQNNFKHYFSIKCLNKT